MHEVTKTIRYRSNDSYTISDSRYPDREPDIIHIDEMSKTLSDWSGKGYRLVIHLGELVWNSDLVLENG